MVPGRGVSPVRDIKFTLQRNRLLYYELASTYDVDTLREGLHVGCGSVAEHYSAVNVVYVAFGCYGYRLNGQATGRIYSIGELDLRIADAACAVGREECIVADHTGRNHYLIYAGLGYGLLKVDIDEKDIIPVKHTGGGSCEGAVGCIVDIDIKLVASHHLGIPELNT